MAQNESQQSEKKENFLLKLIKGDLSLAKTYWVFGVGGNFVLQIIGQVMTFNWIKILQAGYNDLFIIYAWFCWTYFVLISISLWNSALKYKGRFWGHLTMLLVVLGVLLVIMNLFRGYGTTDSLNSINRTLPKMIDSDTQLTSVNISNEGIFYNCKLVNIIVSDIDISDFTDVINKKLIDSVCSNEELTNIMNQYGGLHYVYSDKNDAVITNIPLSNVDCLKR